MNFNRKFLTAVARSIDPQGDNSEIFADFRWCLVSKCMVLVAAAGFEPATKGL